MAVIALGAGSGPPRRSAITSGRAGILIAILDEPRRREGVEVIDGLHLDHADLLPFDEGRHRDDDREFLDVALVVARHRDGGGLAVARQHHLRGVVEQLGVGLGDVEAAERGGRAGERHQLRDDRQDGDAGAQAGLGTGRNPAVHCGAPCRAGCFQVKRCAGRILSMTKTNGASAISAT